MALSGWPLGNRYLPGCVQDSWQVLKAMLDAVANWKRFLTLDDTALRREREWPDNQSIAAYWLRSVRLYLASRAAATAKVTLKAAFAGYSPALAHGGFDTCRTQDPTRDTHDYRFQLFHRTQLPTTSVRITTADAGQPEMFEQLHDGLMTAATDGRLPMARIDESVRRILALKTEYNAGPATGDDLETIQSADHFRIIAAIYEVVADRREQEATS
jgi:hypothetical protein